MKKAQLVFIVFMLLSASMFVTGSTYAEEKNSYAVLLQRVQAFDRTVDFRALRLSYSETREYNPYLNDINQDLMLSLLHEKRYEDALLVARVILKDNYVDIDAHLVCEIIYDKIKKSEQSNYHRFVVRGLLDSIYASGDGSTPEKAYVVIDVREEYSILDANGLESIKHSTLRLGDHNYDKMEVRNPETGEKMVLFFNIDIPYGWLTRKKK